MSSEMMPTRPRNIADISTAFDAVDSIGVTPSDEPTVNSADEVSNRRLLAGRCGSRSRMMSESSV